MSASKPKYDLSKIKKLLCDSDSYRITVKAHSGAAELGYMDAESIVDVIENIQEDDFHKSMPSEKVPGLLQDVYRVNDGNNKIYIKLQLSVNGKKVVVVQFKKK
ncbi:MAG: type II toxin-antitoxin system MqsR family toxin [Nitrospirota bacterium]